MALGAWAFAALANLVSSWLAVSALFAVSALSGLAAWPLFITSYILSLTSSWLPGSVEIEGDVLVVRRGKKTTQIPRRRIVSALVVERPVGDGAIATIEIELAAGDRLVVRAPDLAQARAFVEELGFGPRGARAHVSLPLPSRRLFNPLLGVLAYIASYIVAGVLAELVFRHAEYSAMHVIVAVALYFSLKRLTRPASVTIGDDGVAIDRVRRRVIARRDITAVSRVKDAPLFIGLRDGSHVHVAGLNVDWQRLDAVGRLIEARHGPSTAPPERFTAFERAGVSLAEWKDHIRASIEQSGYRTAASPVEDAAEIVRSPHATPDQRIGAALALRIAGEPPDRIRVAAGAVVDDGVRGALEAIADDDDARAERALRRLSR
jgi:hypothetical protein